MGDWSLMGGMGAVSTYGAAASTLLTAVPCPSDGIGKGAWVLIGTTTRAGSPLFFVNTNTIGMNCLFDISIGEPGAEQVIISNLLFSVGANYNHGTVYNLPITIPAGVKVNVRSQIYHLNASPAYPKSLYAGFTLISPTLKDHSPLSGSYAMGVDTVNTKGTLLPVPGVAHNKGAWVEFSAATPRAFKMVMLCWGFNSATASWGMSNFSLNRVDIAFGTTVVVADLPIYAPGGVYFTNSALLLPLEVPAGTQLQLRQQANSAAADRNFYAAVYGIY